MGSGGVGGYFGARLVQGGADVTFIARGAHLAAMRERGLAIESAHEPIHLPKVNVTDDPKTIGPVDLVMFCVKLWDTEAAARQLLPIMGPETGDHLVPERRAEGRHAAPDLRRRRSWAASPTSAPRSARPGVIAQTGPLQRLVFGEYDGRRSPRAETFLAACKAGGINAEISDDVRRSIWEKFVVLVAMSGATTSMRKTIGPIRANPLTREFLLDLAREVVAVGRAHGVNLPADYAEQRIPFFDGWPPDMTASMHHDLQAGKPLEVRWLSGRRRRPRRAGRRADADEPRGARYPRPARRGQGRGARIDGGPDGRRLAAPDASRIRAVGVEVPMTYALGTSRATITKAPLLLIDLETEEGVTGRSYLWCYLRGVMPAIASVLAEVERVVKGEPASRRPSCGASSRSASRSSACRASCAWRCPALDMAAWDALAIAAGVPLATVHRRGAAADPGLQQLRARPDGAGGRSPTRRKSCSPAAFAR